MGITARIYTGSKLQPGSKGTDGFCAKVVTVGETAQQQQRGVSELFHGGVCCFIL
jgi:hypothetical protein